VNRRVYALALFQPSLFVLDTPRRREVIKRRLAYRSHGNLTPPRIAPSCPHLLRRLTDYAPASTLDFMAGQEYHYPHCLLSPYREQPGIYSRRFLAHHTVHGLTSNNHKSVDLVSVLLREIVAQPLTWLPLTTAAMGMCLMNGYEVFKGQTHSPPYNGEQVRGKLPSHPFPQSEPFFQPCFSKMFLIAVSAAFTAFPTA
jgi:hypothetical protein